MNVAGDEERLILATGRDVGEGFDDARLDTLFLTMSIAWHNMSAAGTAGMTARKWIYQSLKEAGFFASATAGIR